MATFTRDTLSFMMFDHPPVNFLLRLETGYVDLCVEEQNKMQINSAIQLLLCLAYKVYTVLHSPRQDCASLSLFVTVCAVWACVGVGLAPSGSPVSSPINTPACSQLISSSPIKPWSSHTTAPDRCSNHSGRWHI